MQAQPAPQVSVPAPKFQKSSPKLTTLKMSNLGPSMRKTNDADTPKAKADIQEPVNQELDSPYTENDVIFQWNKMINAMPHEQKAMQIRMRNMTPARIDENIYQITANNAQIAQNLNNMMASILAAIRTGLKNNKFQLNVRVAEAEEIKHFISKPEMFKSLLAQNSGIELLNEMLHLEII